ncbi:peptidoglycan O-acetyltransferase [mine drainage metagenome]|uniref:Peptidoglycan O-acetyltransferase n=1 Tax=mine drainage metagenome TaxID=410659 RepID=A0A1J5S0V5_9ZZZZ
MTAITAPSAAVRFARPVLVAGCLGLSALLYGRDWKQAALWLALILLVRALRHHRRIPLWLAVSLSLLPLLAVKTSLTGGIGLLGLSFATFRAIDMLLSEQDGPPPPLPASLLYLTFPPVLITGPMLRWRDFSEDVQAWPRGMGRQPAAQGAAMLALGLIQKFLCADLLQTYVLPTLPAHIYRPGLIVANAVAYSAFLYFDFAGYSNMMAGLCRLFGFRCPLNFRNPILSADPRDFWRRWHISLSEWLRDMVFFPLYRASQRRPWLRAHRLLAQNGALFATLFLMGTWNGLTPRYIASGAVFGLMSVTENSLTHLGQRWLWLKRFAASRPGGLCARLGTISGALAALYLFSGRGPL